MPLPRDKSASPPTPSIQDSLDVKYITCLFGVVMVSGLAEGVLVEGSGQ